MHYFDTSFIVPLILHEPNTDSIVRFVGSLPPDELTISEWTQLEFVSVISREVRMGHLSARDARIEILRFNAMVESSFKKLSLMSSDIVQARRYLVQFSTNLRTGDSLHLAIASNHGATEIYSLDKKMIQAGQMLGLPIGGGNTPGYVN